MRRRITLLYPWMDGVDMQVVSRKAINLKRYEYWLFCVRCLVTKVHDRGGYCSVLGPDGKSTNSSCCGSESLAVGIEVFSHLQVPSLAWPKMFGFGQCVALAPPGCLLHDDF